MHVGFSSHHSQCRAAQAWAIIGGMRRMAKVRGGRYISGRLDGLRELSPGGLLRTLARRRILAPAHWVVKQADTALVSTINGPHRLVVEHLTPEVSRSLDPLRRLLAHHASSVRRQGIARTLPRRVKGFQNQAYFGARRQLLFTESESPIVHCCTRLFRNMIDFSTRERGELHAYSTGTMRKLLLFCLASAVLVAQAPAPAVLNNQRICDLVTTGVSAAEVLRIIGTAPKIDFDLRPVSTDALMKAGVSEDIIKAMAARESGQAVPRARRSSVRDPHLQEVTGSRKLLKDVVDADPNAGAGKPRVFVQGSNDAWSIEYGKKGGSHPQTVELMKSFGQSCPNVIITNSAQNAQYTVAFERESGKVWRRDNKMVVFNDSGDMVYAASTRELGNAVRGFCTLLQRPR